MPNDIELLKQDFLAYLSVLVFPSPEILTSKISTVSPETKLHEIKIKPDSDKIVITYNKNKDECYLTKSELGKYGLSIEDFRKYIEDIKNKDSEKLFFQAIEEITSLHLKNLCKIYVPKAILAYANLCEKLKSQPQEPISKIYNLLDLSIYSSSLNKQTETLEYNYFKRAYQGYANSTGFAFFSGLETENLKIIFNITRELKLNFTPYQAAYTTLINLIEELYIHGVCKTVPESLIDNLKLHTDKCFSSLMQTHPDKKIAFTKTTIENFISTTQKLIKNHIENDPVEYKKQRSILDRLFWFITKLIPCSIFSEDSRMTLFGNYTESGMKIKNLGDEVKRAANSIY